MDELWDIYDANKKKTGKLCRRGIDKLQKGEYHIVVNAIILNSKNEILMSKRAKHKQSFPLLWEFAGGSILAGETSLEGVLREVKEELGIEFSVQQAIFFKEIRREKALPDFKELWLFQKDIAIKDICFTDGEAIDAKWVSINEFLQMYQKGEIVPSICFGEEEYEQIVKIKNRGS